MQSARQLAAPCRHTGIQDYLSKPMTAPAGYREAIQHFAECCSISILLFQQRGFTSTTRFFQETLDCSSLYLCLLFMHLLFTPLLLSSLP
jgi:hypothetical protein